MAWIVTANWVEPWLRAMGRVSLDGGLVIVGVWLICRTLPRISPSLRSWIWRCVYLKLILLALWQGPIPVPLLPELAVRIGRAQTPSSIETTPPDSRASTWESAPGTPRLPPSRSNRSKGANFGVGLFWVWVGGVLFITFRTVRNVIATQRTLRDGRPLTDAGVCQESEALSHCLRLKRSPRLLAREDVSGPQAVGLWRPVLLTPYRSEFPAQSGEFVRSWVLSPAPVTREKFTLHLKLTAEDKELAVLRLAEL